MLSGFSSSSRVILMLCWCAGSSGCSRSCWCSTARFSMIDRCSIFPMCCSGRLTCCGRWMNFRRAVFGWNRVIIMCLSMNSRISVVRSGNSCCC